MTFREQLKFALAMPKGLLLRKLLERARRMFVALVRRPTHRWRPYYARHTGDGPARLPYSASILETDGDASLGRRDDGAVLIDPVSLLTPFRFDIVAKAIYAEHRERGVESAWAASLYDEVNRVWNGHWEFEPRKQSAREFRDSFDVILDSIKASGFTPDAPPIQVAYNGTPIDGAHRVAACLVYGRYVACEVRPADEGFPDFGAQYFRQHHEHVPTGLAQQWSDPIALEYAKIKDGTHVFTLFPSAAGQKDTEVIAILERYGYVVYDNSVPVTEEGMLNLVRLIYEGNSWVGSFDDGFAGARWKARQCLGGGGDIRVFLVECGRLEDVLRAKEEVRALFSLGKDSVHATDSHEETFRVAGALLNPNSRHFLTHARPSEFRNFSKLFDRFTAWLNANHLDPAEYCVDASAVLSAYGLRDCGDFDVLHHRGDELRGTGLGIRSHNEAAHYYALGKDEIIFNPEHHFYYRGVKFVSLRHVREMKARRDEEKDRRDVHLIDGLMAAR